MYRHIQAKKNKRGTLLTVSGSQGIKILFKKYTWYQVWIDEVTCRLVGDAFPALIGL